MLSAHGRCCRRPSAGIGGRRLGRDVALRDPVHASMHDVETAGEIGIRASAVRQHQLQVRENGPAPRTSAPSRCRAWCRRCIAQPGRDRTLRHAARVPPARDGSAPACRALPPCPERIERELADVGVLDIRGNDHAAGAERGWHARAPGRRPPPESAEPSAIQAKRSALSAHHAASVSLSIRCQATHASAERP